MIEPTQPQKVGAPRLVVFARRGSFDRAQSKGEQHPQFDKGKEKLKESITRLERSAFLQGVIPNARVFTSGRRNLRDILTEKPTTQRAFADLHPLEGLGNAPSVHPSAPDSLLESATDLLHDSQFSLLWE